MIMEGSGKKFKRREQSTYVCVRACMHEHLRDQACVPVQVCAPTRACVHVCKPTCACLCACTCVFPAHM